MYIFILLSAGDYVVVDVGTSMEGNFLGGTKNTKKVVHFECGSTQGKWFGGNNGGGGGRGGGTVEAHWLGSGGRVATTVQEPSTLLLLVRYARQQRLKDQLTNKKKEKPT